MTDTSVSRQTVVATLLAMASVIAGLGSSLVVGYYYGASQARDAFLVAQVLPSYVVSVVTGNLSLMFLPIFVGLHVAEPARAWKLAGSVVSLTGLVLAAIALLSSFFTAPLIHRLAPGFSAPQAQLTGELFLILLPSCVSGGVAGVISALYYSERKFVRPGVAPIAGALVAVCINAGLHARFGIYSLGAGVSLGSLVTLLILLPGLFGPGRLSLSIHLRDEQLKRVFRSSLPLFLAGLVYRFNDGFERMIGSNLPAGSLSYLAYATQATTVLSSLTSTGVSRAIVPLLSKGWAEGDLESVRRYFGIGVRSILIVALPVVAVVIAFGSTLVATAYQRGAFVPATTHAVAECLSWLMLGYVAANLGALVCNCFYVTQKTVFLAFYTVIETALYVALAWGASRWLSYRGLALATSVRDVVSLLIYLYFAHRIFGGIHGRQLLIDVAKIVACAAAFLGTALTAKHLLQPSLPALAVLGVGTSLGAGVYLLLATRVFRIAELSRLLVVLRRMRQKS